MNLVTVSFFPVLKHFYYQYRRPNGSSIVKNLGVIRKRARFINPSIKDFVVSQEQVKSLAQLFQYTPLKIW